MSSFLEFSSLNRLISIHFLLSGFYFTDTGDSQDRRGREGTMFYSTLPLPLAYKHSFSTLHGDYYHILLIAPLLFTRLLLDEIYHLIELPFDWLTMWFWFLFVYLMISFSVFVTSIWHGKPVNSRSLRVPVLHNKRTD